MSSDNFLMWNFQSTCLGCAKGEDLRLKYALVVHESEGTVWLYMYL